jgi:hypothetical protein
MTEFEVSLRQSIGPWWTSRPDDAEQAAALLEGKLALPPHPTWILPGDIDWTADPFGQKNWRFQLHCLKWLDPLRRVAMTEHENAARAQAMWNDVVASWIEYNLHGNDPFAWMDMADGVRAIALVLGAPIASEKLKPEIDEALRVHVQRLSDPSRRAIGNHAMHQLSGLFVISRYLELPDVQEYAVSELESLFHHEYDEQGTNAEASLSYHDLNYHWWNEVISRLETEGVSANHLRSTLELSRKSIVHFVRPDGYLEMIGDTAESKTVSADESPENLYVRSQGTEGMPPEDTQLTLDAGYAVGRSGWGTTSRSFENETFYTLRFGNNNAVHGHDDQGSITVFANGVPWIVDPGMYAYQSHPFRRFFLSRDAHNTIVAPNLTTQPNLSKLLWYHASDIADSYLVHAKPYDGFQIDRLFIYLKPLECFIVFDWVNTSEQEKCPSDFVQRWNFHPTVKVSNGLRSAILEREDKRAIMRWLNRPLLHLNVGNEEPLAGWFSPAYSVATPSNYLDARPADASDLSWCTVISVGEMDVIPISQTHTDTKTVIEVSVEDRKYLLTVDSNTTEMWETYLPSRLNRTG